MTINENSVRSIKNQRRDFLKTTAAVGSAAALSGCATVGSSGPKVVVVGGGYGGATVAKYIKMWGPNIDVTVIERNADFISCPISNLVLGGSQSMKDITLSYDTLQKKYGVKLVRGEAAAIDVDRKVVRLASGDSIAFDRVIVSPGVDFMYDLMPGLNNSAAQKRVLHAWKAGAQTLALRKQLESMADGGVVAISIPEAPYRCPPGPYERASLIAWYLKTHKPKSKLTILDAKDSFSKQKLFQAAWKSLYPGLLEWVSLSGGGKVTRVDPAGLVFETEFGSHRADVATIVPPQRAGGIAVQAGVADRTGWCPIDPVTFESRLVPGIHVIGDAAIAGAMPKSAFAANAQGKVCAWAVVALLRGETPPEPRLINTCYSLVAPDYGISVAGVYRPVNGVLADIEGAGGTSPLDAPDAQRVQEARYAETWFKTITDEAFG